MHVCATVEHPVHQLTHGKIKLVVRGHEPVSFTWSSTSGHDVQLDATGSEAYGLRPGRYSVVISDASNAQETMEFAIQPILSAAIMLEEYTTTPATTSASRDGAVEAHGPGLEGWKKFIWSNGVLTDTPRLMDVPVGTYAICPLPIRNSVPSFVHLGAPAVVQARARV